MTQIQGQSLSKRYGYQWIIRELDLEFNTGSIHGIAGGNGSGKSTLIKMLSGFLSPTSGWITYTIGHKTIPVQRIFPYISLVAPYTDMINEFTLKEVVDFHGKFKPFKRKFSYQELEDIIQLKGHGDKTLQNFSSGMKQKVQLALGLLSDTPILLLDEPTAYLDKNAKSWFTELLSAANPDTLVVIASNDTFDLDLCQKILYLDQ